MVVIRDQVLLLLAIASLASAAPLNTAKRADAAVDATSDAVSVGVYSTAELEHFYPGAAKRAASAEDEATVSVGVYSTDELEHFYPGASKRAASVEDEATVSVGVYSTGELEHFYPGTAKRADKSTNIIAGN
ncbi:hypothetical protein N431DRAFT_442695 [Stipitochalara longipes BDJ]|nr:hypothetical protein N431DRAFT_442695 [Stipitochalara longipes BDJ]